MSRQFLFRNYSWLALLGVTLAAALILYFYKDRSLPLLGSVLTTGLAFCYFIQQQRLAETSLFKSLFTEFNARYDKLNGPLSEIPESDEGISREAKKCVIDYFNLCAEEYLFYKEGYIQADVWRSWCRGMLLYFDRRPFSHVWQAEQATNSYYGLSLQIIRKGSK